MNVLEWKHEYSVGNQKIDMQHKELFTIVNNFINYTNDDISGADKEFLRSLLEPAVRFIRKHFETEETILSKTEYQDLDKHTHEHQSFLAALTEKINEIIEKKEGCSINTLLSFVKEWYLNHLLTLDKPAEEFFRKKHP